MPPNKNKKHNQGSKKHKVRPTKEENDANTPEDDSKQVKQAEEHSPEEKNEEAPMHISQHQTTSKQTQLNQLEKDVKENLQKVQEDKREEQVAVFQGDSIQPLDSQERQKQGEKEVINSEKPTQENLSQNLERDKEDYEKNTGQKKNIDGIEEDSVQQSHHSDPTVGRVPESEEAQQKIQIEGSIQKSTQAEGVSHVEGNSHVEGKVQQIQHGENEEREGVQEPKEAKEQAHGEAETHQKEQNAEEADKREQSERKSEVESESVKIDMNQPVDQSESRGGNSGGHEEKVFTLAESQEILLSESQEGQAENSVATEKSEQKQGLIEIHNSFTFSDLNLSHEYPRHEELEAYHQKSKENYVEPEGEHNRQKLENQGSGRNHETSKPENQTLEVKHDILQTKQEINEGKHQQPQVMHQELKEKIEVPDLKHDIQDTKHENKQENLEAKNSGLQAKDDVSDKNHESANARHQISQVDHQLEKESLKKIHQSSELNHEIPKLLEERHERLETQKKIEAEHEIPTVQQEIKDHHQLVEIVHNVSEVDHQISKAQHNNQLIKNDIPDSPQESHQLQAKKEIQTQEKRQGKGNDHFRLDKEDEEKNKGQKKNIDGIEEDSVQQSHHSDPTVGRVPESEEAQQKIQIEGSLQKSTQAEGVSHVEGNSHVEGKVQQIQHGENEEREGVQEPKEAKEQAHGEAETHQKEQNAEEADKREQSERKSEVESESVKIDINQPVDQSESRGGNSGGHGEKVFTLAESQEILLSESQEGRAENSVVTEKSEQKSQQKLIEIQNSYTFSDLNLSYQNPRHQELQSHREKPEFVHEISNDTQDIPKVNQEIRAGLLQVSDLKHEFSQAKQESPQEENRIPLLKEEIHQVKHNIPVVHHESLELNEHIKKPHFEDGPPQYQQAHTEKISYEIPKEAESLELLNDTNPVTISRIPRIQIEIPLLDKSVGPTVLKASEDVVKVNLDGSGSPIQQRNGQVSLEQSDLNESLHMKQTTSIYYRADLHGQENVTYEKISPNHQNQGEPDKHSGIDGQLKSKQLEEGVDLKRSRILHRKVVKQQQNLIPENQRRNAPEESQKVRNMVEEGKALLQDEQKKDKDEKDVSLKSGWLILLSIISVAGALAGVLWIKSKKSSQS